MEFVCVSILSVLQVLTAEEIFLSLGLVWLVPMGISSIISFTKAGSS